MRTAAEQHVSLATDRAAWDELLARAAESDSETLRNNAQGMQRALVSVDKNDGVYTKDELGKTLGFVFTRCREAGVVISAP